MFVTQELLFQRAACYSSKGLDLYLQQRIYRERRRLHLLVVKSDSMKPGLISGGHKNQPGDAATWYSAWLLVFRAFSVMVADHSGQLCYVYETQCWCDSSFHSLTSAKTYAALTSGWQISLLSSMYRGYKIYGCIFVPFFDL